MEDKKMYINRKEALDLVFCYFRRAETDETITNESNKKRIQELFADLNHDLESLWGIELD